MTATVLSRRKAADETTSAPAVTTSASPAVPTYDDVIAAIMRESNEAGVRCDRRRADRVVRLFRRVVARGGKRYVLTSNDLNINGGPHDVMEKLVPDVERDAQPHTIRPGSAEALLTAHLLPPVPGQPPRRFIHTSDFEDHIRYCVVSLQTV